MVEAVSDIIGVVLMVALVVVGIGVVGIFVVGQETPIEIPSLSMIPAKNGNDLYLYHNGGDSLNKGEFFVIVDGDYYYPDDMKLLLQDGEEEGEGDWDSWDLGESMIVENKGNYNSVMIMSTLGGQASIIAGSGEASSSTTASTTVPTPGSPPVAGFTGSPVSGYAPLTVTFTDLSTESPTSWEWDFGDGETAAGQNPVHEYAAAGTYTVKLRASNAYGFDYENKTDYITVNAFPDPAAWWKFDETSGSTAYDSSGNGNNGNIHGSVSHVSEGACDGALYFDGTSTYVLVGDSDTLDAPHYLTYAAWLKPETPIIASGVQPVYYNYTSLIDKGENDNDNYDLFIRRLGSTSEFSFETDSSHASGGYHDPLEYSTTAFNYYYNQWQHVAFVADTDSGTAKLYINGEYAATLTPSLDSSFITNDYDLTLGRQQMNSPYYFYYKGLMDDVMLFTSALNDDEIRGIYDRCTPSYPPVAEFAADETSGGVPFNVTFTDLSTNYPTAWTWDFGDGSTSTDQNPSHIYKSAGTYTVNLTVSNSYGNDSEVKTDYISVTAFPEPAAWWKFDETSGSTVYDSSGNNNDGAIYGPATRIPEGACDGALYFDGTNTYVLVDDSDTLDAPHYLTYAAWLRPEVPEDYGYANYTSLIEKGNTDVDNYELFASRDGSISEFTFETYSDYFRDYSTNSFTYDYNKWQHLAFVADTGTGTAKLYVDGEYAATLTSSLPSEFDTNSNPLTLGIQQYSGHPFYYRGLMDDVMLFTSALTDVQINEIYDMCNPSYAPVADFSAADKSGAAPFTVTFTDLSTDGPTSWNWDFGDGQTSTEQNPSHVYNSAGTYSVSLTATNTYGSDVEEKTDYITVSQSRSDIIINTARPYYFKSGSELEFDVTSSSSIFFDGSYVSLPQGTDVRIVLMSDQDGSIDIGSSGTINTLEFDDANLYINGILYDNYGSVSDAWIPGYSDMYSTLSIIIPYPDYSAYTSLDVDGNEVDLPVQTPVVYINNMYPDSDDVFRLSYSRSWTYLRCSAESYEITEPVIADFSGSPLFGRSSLNVKFTDESSGNPTGWLWDFGDGETSTEQNPTHTYSTNINWNRGGEYFTVTLTVEGPGNTDTHVEYNYVHTWK